MKTSARAFLATVVVAVALRAADDSTTAAPKNLLIEATVIRFKPESKEQILQDFKLPNGASNAVEALRKTGRPVDVLYRGIRDVVAEPNRVAKFDATETRPVLLLGAPGAPVPPATVYGLTLQISVRPTAGDSIVMAWEGTLNWSPEMMDRRGGVQNTMQFIGKAANVAQGASQLAGDAQGTVKQAADIGLAVAELFRGQGTDSHIYELPVVKNFSLHGSRVCKPGQMVVSTTAAEAGVKEPQIIFLLLDVRNGD